MGLWGWGGVKGPPVVFWGGIWGAQGPLLVSCEAGGGGWVYGAGGGEETPSGVLGGDLGGTGTLSGVL